MLGQSALANIALAAEQTPSDAPVLPDVEGRVLHLDGDVLAYWASGNKDTPVGVSRHVAIERTEMLMRAGRCERAIIHLTGRASDKGDRYLIAQVKGYQGQRGGGEKPKNYTAMREFLETFEGTPRIQRKVWTRREADDGVAACAAYAYHNQPAPGGVPNAVIVSPDKDFRMIPGIHLSWDGEELAELAWSAYSYTGADDKEYGIRWFYLQLLHGDSADNIPGLPGYVARKGTKPVKVGPVTAQNILVGDVHGSLRVIDAYRGYYEDDWAPALAEQAMLLWLRRDATAQMDDYLNYWPDAPAQLIDATAYIKERVLNERANTPQAQGA